MSEPTKRNTLSLKSESPSAAATHEERLHKVLANAGVGSRRLIEERIRAGEIILNGKAAELGAAVRSGDKVEVDGKAFVAAFTGDDDARVLLYHKPEGEVTTTDDPEGRPTIFESLPRLKGMRWVSVGRLDINTTGLLILTTDGELANKLMHPSSEVQREYICRVQGEVTDEMVNNLKKGVVLDDGPAKFDEIAVINLGDSHSWFRVVLHEGRNREVRRMWESQGVTVSRLKRTRYGSIELPRLLRRGHFAPLDIADVKKLREDMGLTDAPRVLTLQPISGIRRASRTTETTTVSAEQRAWSSSTADEAREYRAIDKMGKDDSRLGARRKSPAGGKRKPGANRPRSAGKGPITPNPYANNKPRGPRKASKQHANAAAVASANPAEFRAWVAGEYNKDKQAESAGRGRRTSSGKPARSTAGPGRSSSSGRPSNANANPYASPYAQTTGDRDRGGAGKPFGKRKTDGKPSGFKRRGPPKGDSGGNR